MAKRRLFCMILSMATALSLTGCGLFANKPEVQPIDLTNPTSSPNPTSTPEPTGNPEAIEDQTDMKEVKLYASYAAYREGLCYGYGEYVYEYKDGNLVEEKYYWESNMSYWTEYNYDNNGILKDSSTYDKKDTLINYCEYNDEGTVIASTEYDRNGNLTFYTEYNDDGQETYQESFDGGYEVETKYDESGKIYSKEIDYDESGAVESIFESYYCDGDPNPVERYKFDADGNVLFHEAFGEEPGTEHIMYTYNENGEVTRWNEYEFDGKGRKLSCDSHNGTGELRAKYEWEYYDDGTLKYNFNDCISYAYSYAYDENGNCTMNCNYDANGNIEEYWTYEHDENGNTTITTKYDSDDNIIAYTKNTYDEDGNKIRSEGKNSDDYTENRYETVLIPMKGKCTVDFREDEKQVVIF